MSERAELKTIELLALRGELLPDHVSERQIHIVAAEQDVITDRDPLQCERAVLLDRVNQRKIAGATADIDNQHAVTGSELAAPTLAVLLDPGIQGRLRLFQQRHLFE